MALTQVKSDGIATGAVTATQIAADAVTVDDIADGSISTAKLADDAVTADKLADTAVTAGSYTLASVTVDAQGRITSASSGTAGDADKIEEGNTSAEVVDTGSDGHFKVVTEGTEALRVDSSQRVGIGTASPASDAQLTIDNGGTGDVALFLRRSGSTQGDAAIANEGSDITFSVGSSDTVAGLNEAARIDSSGRLLVGTDTSIVGKQSQQRTLQVAKANASTSQGVGIYHFHSGGQSPNLELGLSKNNTLGSHTAVSSGDNCGSIIWSGSAGSEFEQLGSIAGVCDGTPSGTSMPGRLVFFTTASGSVNPTDRAVIDSTGRLNLSTASQASSFTRDASLRIMSGTITRNADFAMMNTGYSGVMVHLSCERGGTGSYNFMDLYSGRRYDNSSGDRETSLQGDGNNYCDGSWSGGGADYAEMFEWSDANPDAEDRRGLSVVLDGDKIREAVAGEDPIGVISGNPSVVGDTAWNKWNEKYLTDDFGTYQKETYSLTEWQDENGDTQSYESDRIPSDVTVPDDAVIKTVDDAGVTLTRRVLNPNYDPNVTYVPREQRAEWDAVGLMGKLRIRKGQVTGARWIKMRDVSDTVEEWLVR